MKKLFVLFLLAHPLYSQLYGQEEFTLQGIFNATTSHLTVSGGELYLLNFKNSKESFQTGDNLEVTGSLSRQTTLMGEQKMVTVTSVKRINHLESPYQDAKLKDEMGMDITDSDRKFAELMETLSQKGVTPPERTDRFAKP